MNQQAKWTVDYNIAGSTGTLTAHADENSDREHIIALAKECLVRATRGVGLPIGYESYQVSREDA